MNPALNNNFLGLPENLSDYSKSKVVVLPLPYEATVTYGKGTAKGPEAIIQASQQVEFYDREFDLECVQSFGIHTLPSMNLSKNQDNMIEEITQAVIPHINAKKTIVGIGGEHSVSAGLVKGQLKAGTSPLTIVQIDAHSDLRDSYEGNKYNHACVARRFLDNELVEQVIQFGIRSISSEEMDFARANSKKVRIWFTEDMNDGYEEFISLISGRKVYLTIDVDGLDPGVITATGTPEPDGLSWRQTMEIIRIITRKAELTAMDCVELAPVPGMHASDYAAAKLIYKALCLKYFSI